MIEEIVGEEIPVTWLSLNAPHRDKVGRVDTISQELESESWSKWL